MRKRTPKERIGVLVKSAMARPHTPAPLRQVAVAANYRPERIYSLAPTHLARTRPCRRSTSTTNFPFDTCRVAQILDAISSNRGPIRIHTRETPERVDQLPIWDKIVSDSWTGFWGALPALTQSAGISKRHRRPSLSKARSTAPPSSNGITSRTTHVP